ncbi:MAG: hypothetical protein PHH06_00820 [Candidatus Gracilibacteria bacterium]|nr:hypothetical protein [Candidatus Gracilibacteria bacterium]
MSISILLDCLEKDSVTGTESFSSFSIFLKKTIESFGGKYISNHNGDIIGFFGDLDSKDTYVLESHIDEVGFFINSIKNGEIYVGCIGKYNFGYLDGIEGADVFKTEGDNKYYGIINYIGNGCFKLSSDYKDKFNVGDILSFKRSIINGKEYTIAPSLDNKVGCALNLSVAKHIKDFFIKQGKKLAVVFSSGEEIRQNSSAYFLSQQNLNIKKVYIIDAAYAEPIVTDGLHMNIPTSGFGPAIQHIGESFVIPKIQIDYIKDIANKNNIPLQDEIAILELGRTNQLFFYRYGWDVAVINIPVAFQHTIKSKLKNIDYINGIKLMLKVLENDIS